METNSELLRVLTLKDAVAVGLGAIIGAGIFVVTGVAAGISGPAMIIGLIIAGIVASFNALSSAQLAAVYPHSGGTYEYGYQLLNPTLGFSAGWMFLISKLSAAGVVAIGFGNYFYQLFPFVSPLYYSVTAVALLTIANFLGIKKAGILNNSIVSITIISLLYLIVSGFPEIKKENFEPFAPFGISSIAEATAILFFAFTGYARIATLAEEVKEPEKTIPRAVIITIVIAIVLYVLICIVAIGVIGAEDMAATKSPLQQVAASLSTPALSEVITLGASTAMLGVLLSQILGISRMMLAMGRRKDLPLFFEKIHPVYKVPYIAIITTAFIIILLTIVGSFEYIVKSASFSILLYYSITNIAALKQPPAEQRFGIIIPFLGLMGCLLMVASLPFSVICSGFVILFLGYVLKNVFNKF